MQIRTRVLVVLSLSVGVISFSWANYSAVLPLVVADLTLSGTEAGVIYSAYFVGYVLAILPAGIIADRDSPRRLVGITAIGTGVFSVAFAYLTVGVVTGSVFRILAGACFAGVYVPGMKLLSDWFDAGDRGRAFGLYVGVLSLGSGVAYPLSTWLATVDDWRFAIAVTSSVAVPAGLAVLWLAADATGTGTGDVAFDFSVFREKKYLYVTTAYASHNWELFGVQNWIVAFLVATPAVVATGSPEVTAGVLGGVLVAFGAPGNVLGGWLSDRLGRIPTSGGALAASGVITVSLGIFDWTIVAVLAGVILVYGIVLAADSAPLSTAMSEIADDDHVGAALAGQSLLGFIPGMISPVVFGVALDRSGFAAAFGTLFVGVVVGLGSLWLLRRELDSEPDFSITGR
ncbi:major facilitator superfamily MFS_1 [Halalkaliarchaeum desulfuricum]|uniref:Major facilitator superfamily MFS_1 n=1 Tax=Halalkaliarchaeum desulfuricum TaxID=2055893 RepID=A0A343TFG0_9EURY|nr:MFS transporter [Halalkaliarchaeum desulfuricum]AUX07832.1 major facilitator superfamily MFS_1 [Halalkaliarchaeum desulfuricum]